MTTRIKLLTGTAAIVCMMAIATPAQAETSLMDKVRGFFMPSSAAVQQDTSAEGDVVGETELQEMTPELIEPSAGEPVQPVDPVTPSIENSWESVPGADVPSVTPTADVEEHSFIPRSGFENPVAFDDGSDLNDIVTASGSNAINSAQGFENPVMDGSDLNDIMTAAGGDEEGSAVNMQDDIPLEDDLSTEAAPADAVMEEAPAEEAPVEAIEEEEEEVAPSEEAAPAEDTTTEEAVEPEAVEDMAPATEEVIEETTTE